ncbi:long-chain-acyl-CoA dehydrogenase [Microbacterium sp. cf046]|uniref:acyl-CoA dehydrogenase family protein n=1 Tax=Microbacterium sp. cf046 TaxID=1761803 RepID=UPI0008EFEAFB|nr:acyl-CoA dehydrogenase family protein [Microbacterium sp. cf046]SFS14598.1 long-chain-acyl-CoA dehydrogenase [Microbacterium sp. cf046]
MKRHLYEPAHEAYRARVREFLERVVVPAHPTWIENRIVGPELYTGLAEIGALAHGMPAEYGGTGVNDFRYNLILTEEATRLHVFPPIVGPSLVVDIIAPYIVDMGTEEQKARWLPGVIRGETVLGIAMTEPGTGSDLAGIQTTAVRDGDHWALDGTKKFIGNGLNAGLVIVAARTSEDRHRGLTLLVVDTRTPGYSARNLDKVGMHAHNTTEITLEGVRVPIADTLGAEGDGFRGLTRNLAQERVTASAHALATARAGLDLTIDHVRERETFGRPIGANQTVRFTIAELATELDIAQSFVDDCVRALNARDLTPVDAAKAKWWTTEFMWKVLDTGVQLHGGDGYLPEHPITQLWLDSRAQRIYAGSTEIMKDLIGKSMRLA